MPLNECLWKAVKQASVDSAAGLRASRNWGTGVLQDPQQAIQLGGMPFNPVGVRVGRC